MKKITKKRSGFNSVYNKKKILKRPSEHGKQDGGCLPVTMRIFLCSVFFNTKLPTFTILPHPPPRFFLGFSCICEF